MERVTLRAHFDGRQILLDEPYELAPGTKLVVTVVPESTNDEREVWAEFALENLSQVYGDNEPEYPLNSIKEANPDYERE
jgi:hypothetical protein